MTRWILLVPLLCALGCTAVRETQPERTATEQLIISSAVVDAARQIKADAVAGKKVVVDVTYFKTVDVEFTQGELRDRLLQLGAQLVTDLDQAEVIVEARSGGLGIDDTKTNIGIPSIPIPVPSVGAGLGFVDLQDGAISRARMLSGAQLGVRGCGCWGWTGVCHRNIAGRSGGH